MPLNFVNIFIAFYLQAMESNQNLENLEGLPLDMWVGSQQQSQLQMSVTTRSGYPQVTEPHLGREFLIQRGNPPQSSLDKGNSTVS